VGPNKTPLQWSTQVLSPRATWSWNSPLSSVQLKTTGSCMSPLSCDAIPPHVFCGLRRVAYFQLVYIKAQCLLQISLLVFVMFDYHYSDYFPTQNLSVGVFCVRVLRFFRQCYEDYCLQGFQFWWEQSCSYARHEGMRGTACFVYS
jgi:hypothetical protein